jgi:hypothetical protein
MLKFVGNNLSNIDDQNRREMSFSVWWAWLCFT